MQEKLKPARIPDAIIHVIDPVAELLIQPRISHRMDRITCPPGGIG